MTQIIILYICKCLLYTIIIDLQYTIDYRNRTWVEIKFIDIRQCYDEKVQHNEIGNISV